MCTLNLIMVIIMSWKTDTNEEEKKDTFAEAKARIKKQIKARNEREKSFLLCSITGDPKVGKTGTAMDCRTPKEIEEGYKVFVLDFDDGAEPTWDSGWDRDENIIIFNPIEMKGDGTVNWNETFQNAHSFITYVKEEIETSNVKAIIFDGVDKAYEGSGDVLREHLVRSSKREGLIIHDTDSVAVKPLDWKIRNRVYNRLLDAFISIDADRFLITHMKPIYGNIVNPVPIGVVPDWHKSTPARFTQMIHINKIKSGATTNYIAELQASKTNPSIVGKEWTVFVTNGENVWSGIPELREGKL